MSSNMYMLSTWQGQEAAAFLSETCELPQYALTAERTLSLKALLQLRSRGDLTKGLSRAGIQDLQHQQRIRDELKKLPDGTAMEILDGEHQVLKSSSGLLASTAAKALLSSKHSHSQVSLPTLRRSASIASTPSTNIGAPELTSTLRRLSVKSCSTGCLARAVHRSSDRKTPAPFDTAPFHRHYVQ